MGKKGYGRALIMFMVLIICAVPVIASPAYASSIESAVSYVRRCQRDDGGFAEPGRGSSGSDGTTAWVVIGLSAAGVNPCEVRKNGRSPLDFLASRSGEWNDATDYERTILAVSAAGLNPRDFGGVDLVSRLQSKVHPDGSIAGAVNGNAFGILAYCASGVNVPASVISWHKSVQNADGGWGNAPGQASNPDMTAASVMALAAVGTPKQDPSIGRALDFLHRTQNDDGGFSFQRGASDTGSTSWVVQALVAAGEDPAGPDWSRGGNTPFSFVAGMQASDGHFQWTQGKTQNPLWMTSYSICALARKPWPVSAPPASPSISQEQASPTVPDVPGTVAEETEPVPNREEAAPGEPGGTEGVELEGMDGDEETQKGTREGVETGQGTGQDRSMDGIALAGEEDGETLDWWKFSLIIGVPLLALAIAGAVLLAKRRKSA